MKRFILIFILAACSCTAMLAQRPDGGNPMTPEERERWLEEYRTFKHEFLSRELSLTKEQQDEFFPIYDQMDDELAKIASETRQMERTVNDNAEATDEELQGAAFTLFEQKNREATVEMSYFEKYKEILSPRQLFRLKNAERKFTQELVRKHQGRNRQQPR